MTRHPPHPLRVVIADDELRVRRGLAMRLDLEPDLDVVAQAASAPDTVAAAASTRPDVVVLDVRMPPSGGLAAIPRLRAEVLGIRIVVLTIHDEQATRARARRAGADAFVSKSAGDDALLRAIRGGTPVQTTTERGGSFMRQRPGTTTVDRDDRVVHLYADEESFTFMTPEGQARHHGPDGGPGTPPRARR